MKQTTNLMTALLCSVGLLGLSLPVWAEDNTTQYYTNGVVTNVTSAIVGNTGTNNYLEVSNATTLNNTGTFTLGQNAGANSNVAVVAGAGSAVNSSSTLYVGNSGSGNQLTIQSGGVFTNSGSFVVGSAGVNNLLLVTGVGSTYVLAGGDGIVGSGATASNNTLQVAAGGKVISTNLRLYGGVDSQVIITNGGYFGVGGVTIGETATATGGRLLVSGSGSTVSDSGATTVGSSGANSTLRIENGGTYTNVGATVIGSAVASSNNVMVVTGSGSIYKNGTDYYVGIGGAGNSLTISSSGQVVTAQTIIGNNASSAGNTVLITGSGSLLTNTGVLHFGLNSVSNQFTIANGGRVHDTEGRIGSSATANDNTFLVTGAGSVWMNSSDVTVGFGVGSSNNVLMVSSGGVVTSSATVYSGGSGHHNQIIVTNGGRIVSNQGLLGNQTSASNNTALITGIGSIWTNSSTMYVGNNAGANQVTIADGGKLYSGQGIIANTATGSSNSVLVTGSGSVWAMTSDGYVGKTGHSNQLTIASGGKVTNAIGYIGDGGNSNRVLVTDGSSLWQNSSTLYVGNNSVGNQLIVSNGAQVTSGAANLGQNVGTRDNTAVVTGNGSSWSVTGDLRVGPSGWGNQLTISDGGQVIHTGHSFVGQGAGASNNTVLVTGAGSLWQGGGEIQIGAVGNNNRLTVASGAQVTNLAGSVFAGVSGHNNTIVITNGGRIVSLIGIIGNTGTNNTAIITGTGSVWTNTSTAFYVGNAAPGNHLEISDGGSLFSKNANLVGRTAASSNNTVLITGTGSFWKTAVDNLDLGSSGASNQITVANGGQIRSFQTIVGNALASSNNNVLITDNGSLLTNDLALYVGNNGAGNRLTITNGAKASSASGIIGNSASSSNNVVVVTGSGSQWDLRTTADFHVGVSGGSNTLIVTDGGLINTPATVYAGGGVGANNQVIVTNGGVIRAIQGLLGNNAASTGNRAIVTGTGSVWSNSTFHFYIGHLGGTNSLTISDGGKVFNQIGLVGNTATSLGNSVLVTGAGSLWQNNSDLDVGNNGTTLGSGNVLATAGGTIEAPLWRAGSGSSGTISNIGGIFQFATSTPTIIPTTAGSIVVTNGTISYRNVSAANVYNSQVSNIVFAGNNTFRLNAASNNNNVASQTYNFTTTLGPTNYARLEMINGDTAYRGGNITIGSGGSMLVSNTTATITGLLTNLGAFSSVNAKATFQSAVYNNGTWATDPTTNTFNSTYTVASGGAITMTPGDVMIFNSDFVNISTNNTGYNTLDGKFLFTGGTTTQRFYTAGHEMGQAPTPGTPTIRLPGNDIGFSNNFALGTLELSNFTTVRVSDAFSLLGPGTNDDLRAALYLNNLFIDQFSYLIVDTNVTVYFANSNGWSSANFALLGDGELHQIFIPEPSSLLLLVIGGVFAQWQRRRTNRSGTINQGRTMTMKQPTNLILAILCSVGLVWMGLPTWAEDNTTQLYTSGGLTNDPGDIYVGSSGTNNYLEVSNATTLTNSGNAYISNSGAARDNLAVVSGAGSAWNIRDYMWVGNLAGDAHLVITNGGSVNSAGGFLGNYGAYYGYPSVTNNSVVVTGTGSVWSNSLLGLNIGWVGSDNQLRIENGGKVYNAGTSYSTVIGGYYSASNNYVSVTGAGSLLSTPSQDVIVGLYLGADSNTLVVANGGRVDTGSGNSLIVGQYASYNHMAITNGGQVYSAQGLIGYLGDARYNSVLVSGSGSVWSNSTYPIYVGLNGSSNQLVISNGGKVYTPTTYVSFGAVSTNNIVNITGSGSLLQNDSIYVGNLTGPTSGQDAHVNVLDGGTLDTPAMYTGITGSGTISNRNGIYQFSSPTPTVFTGTVGSITISNGTISYRNVSAANIYNSQVSNIVFQGQNTFRLNAASNNNNVASQTYTFTTNGPASTYARLELINGDTAYRGGDITIGSGGSMLISNTTATITGLLTNLGAFSSVNAKATFQSTVVNSGTWNTDPTTNTFNSTYTVTSGGSITMTPGDVMEFKSNFVNQSIQSNTFNTLPGTFLFSGTGTQGFFTAGKEMGQAPTPATPTIRLPGNDIGFTNNFALGTLEIANFSTVKVSDAFLGVTDDGLRAALYLNNLFMGTSSFLIVDTNVTVYFANSNNWSLANFALLGDGELHQIFIPEPSVLLLVVAGSVIAAIRRRNRR